MKTRALKSRSGAVLPLVVAICLIFAILGFSVLNLAENQIMMTRKEVAKEKALYAAEGGTEYGIAHLRKLLAEQSDLLWLGDNDLAEQYEIPLPQIAGATFDVFTIEGVGDPQGTVISSGPFAGMYATVRTYKISVQARTATDNAVRAKLVQYIKDQRFNLFQFAVFYNADLELEPGPRMTIEGRIHSNHDIYLTSNNTLSIDSYLTTAGNLYDHSKPGDLDEEHGTVQIKDGSGDYARLSFDSSAPDWKDRSTETWDDRVQTQAHGITPLMMPLPTEFDPIEIIKRGQSGDTDTLRDARFYSQADLRIIDGVAYNSAGGAVDLTYVKNGVTYNPLSTSKSFHNYREGKDVVVTEIDISKLVESGKFPDNGVLYISSHRAGSGQQDGVRLVNGQHLPDSGLTVATDDPLYIQGDYNIDKRPSALYCDAMNFLSNAWTDGTHATLSGATPTQYYVCVAAGHEPTTQAGGYGGGLENLARFLENWDGVTLTWRGSLNSLWFSQIATGKWRYGSPYYTAPIRAWGFQQVTDLMRLPPGTPVICRAIRDTWVQE
jgi:hypothetical protein